VGFGNEIRASLSQQAIAKPSAHLPGKPATAAPARALEPVELRSCEEELLHAARCGPGAALIAAWTRASLARCVGPHGAIVRAVAHAGGAAFHGGAFTVHSARHAGFVMGGGAGRVSERRGAYERQCGARNKKLFHSHLRWIDCIATNRAENESSSERDSYRQWRVILIAKASGAPIAAPTKP
jgi:hypothetical protein